MQTEGRCANSSTVGYVTDKDKWWSFNAGTATLDTQRKSLDHKRNEADDVALNDMNEQKVVGMGPKLQQMDENAQNVGLNVHDDGVTKEEKMALRSSTMQDKTLKQDEARRKEAETLSDLSKGRHEGKDGNVLTMAPSSPLKKVSKIRELPATSMTNNNSPFPEGAELREWFMKTLPHLSSFPEPQTSAIFDQLRSMDNEALQQFYKIVVETNENNFDRIARVYQNKIANKEASPEERLISLISALGRASRERDEKATKLTAKHLNEDLPVKKKRTHRGKRIKRAKPSPEDSGDSWKDSAELTRAHEKATQEGISRSKENVIPKPLKVPPNTSCSTVVENYSPGFTKPDKKSRSSKHAKHVALNTAVHESNIVPDAESELKETGTSTQAASVNRTSSQSTALSKAKDVNLLDQRAVEVAADLLKMHDDVKGINESWQRSHLCSGTVPSKVQHVATESAASKSNERDVQYDNNAEAVPTIGESNTSKEVDGVSRNQVSSLLGDKSEPWTTEPMDQGYPQTPRTQSRKEPTVHVPDEVRMTAEEVVDILNGHEKYEDFVQSSSPRVRAFMRSFNCWEDPRFLATVGDDFDRKFDNWMAYFHPNVVNGNVLASIRKSVEATWARRKGDIAQKGDKQPEFRRGIDREAPLISFEADKKETDPRQTKPEHAKHLAVKKEFLDAFKDADVEAMIEHELMRTMNLGRNLEKRAAEMVKEIQASAKEFPEHQRKVESKIKNVVERLNRPVTKADNTEKAAKVVTSAKSGVTGSSKSRVPEIKFDTLRSMEKLTRNPLHFMQTCTVMVRELDWGDPKQDAAPVGSKTNTELVLKQFEALYEELERRSWILKNDLPRSSNLFSATTSSAVSSVSLQAELDIGISSLLGSIASVNSTFTGSDGLTYRQKAALKVMNAAIRPQRARIHQLYRWCEILHDPVIFQCLKDIIPELRMTQKEYPSLEGNTMVSIMVMATYDLRPSSDSPPHIVQLPSPLKGQDVKGSPSSILLTPKSDVKVETPTNEERLHGSGTKGFSPSFEVPPPQKEFCHGIDESTSEPNGKDKISGRPPDKSSVAEIPPHPVAEKPLTYASDQKGARKTMVEDLSLVIQVQEPGPQLEALRAKLQNNPEVRAVWEEEKKQEGDLERLCILKWPKKMKRERLKQERERSRMKSGIPYWSFTGLDGSPVISEDREVDRQVRDIAGALNK